jgi:hypothetical protein
MFILMVVWDRHDLRISLSNMYTIMYFHRGATRKSIQMAQMRKKIYHSYAHRVFAFQFGHRYELSDAILTAVPPS